MKKLHVIIFLSLIIKSMAFGQIGFVFYHYSEPFSSFFSHRNVQEYTFRYLHVSGFLIKKEKEETAGKYFLDSLGRETHFSRDVNLEGWGEANISKMYREDGCPYYPDSPIDEKGWTIHSHNPSVSMHCQNGFVDTISNSSYRQMIVYVRDTIGRVVEEQHWAEDSLDYRHVFHYDSSGMLKEISGVSRAIVEYEYEDRMVRIIYRWLDKPYFTVEKFYLNENGLVIRVEIDKYLTNLKRFKPDEIFLYEWKMRGD